MFEELLDRRLGNRVADVAYWHIATCVRVTKIGR